ncbi:MAG: TIR domain-containing protein [Pyrinomonadaceae bacterium]
MAHEVFISYAAKDKKTAEAVCSILEDGGIRCWIAPRDILAGDKYGQSIIKAISESSLVILVFSSYANKSEHVLAEIDRAYNKKISIVPFRIEDVALSQSLEYYLSTAHWLDAFTPPMEKRLQDLNRNVKLILERSSKPEPSPEFRQPSIATARNMEPDGPRLSLQQRIFAVMSRQRIVILFSLIVVGGIILSIMVWRLSKKPLTDTGTSDKNNNNSNATRMMSRLDEAALLIQLQEAKKYKSIVEEVARRYGFRPSVIAGMISRESGWGLDLKPIGPAGTGDFQGSGRLPPDGGGFQRGLMAFDYRRDEFARTGNWKEPGANIEHGCTLLQTSLNALRDSGKISDEELLLRAALASFNLGGNYPTAGDVEGVLKSISEGKDVDVRTSHNDYSKDILSRASWFQSHGWE